MDVDVLRSDGIDIDPEIQAKIDECITYADALRDRGIDARVVVEDIDREEIETSMRGLVKEEAVEVTYETFRDLVERFHDHTKEILVHRVQVIESVQMDQGHRIIATGQQSADMSERIRELKQDNRRLRDMMVVASQRVTRKIGNTWSRASRIREGINEQIDHQMAGALEACTTARNLELLIRDGGGFVPTRECTYQDLLKCQSLSFIGTKGVVGLTRWFKKMETVFHISNCPERMVLNEEEKVERFVGELPDNIQGNVITAEPTKLQDAIRVANNLMDQKLKGCARSAKKEKNVARAYTAGNNEKKGYVRSLPYCNKCKLHYAGPCTVSILDLVSFLVFVIGERVRVISKGSLSFVGGGGGTLGGGEIGEFK
ncbi:hypothetical protein Tco_0118093 [Tanacetum coccineum]